VKVIAQVLPSATKGNEQLSLLMGDICWPIIQVSEATKHRVHFLARRPRRSVLLVLPFVKGLVEHITGLNRFFDQRRAFRKDTHVDRA
jgi:hypothetical protein